MKQVTNKLFKLLAVLTVVSLVFSSCQKDEEVFPVPTVTSSGTLAGVTGATVTVKATISAPAGLKSITVLKNGVAFDSKTYSAGEKTAEYSKDYVVEGAAGTVVTFSIQATDLKGQVMLLPSLLKRLLRLKGF